MIHFSFITANCVARELRYSGVEDWGAHDRATRAAQTSAKWDTICSEIRSAGFDHLDLWTAHCHWADHAATDLPQQVPAIARKHGLTIGSYAGGFGYKTPADLEATLGFMKKLGITTFAGGVNGPQGATHAQIAADMQSVCEKLDVRWAFENHPEKSIDAILARIDGGKSNGLPRCGLAIDTGWCGTQGIDAVDAIKQLADHMFLIHLKDVLAPGKHDTCALGDGIVNIQGVVRHLKASNWSGTLCIEHEPYDRDPMPEIITSMNRVRQWLA